VKPSSSLHQVWVPICAIAAACVGPGPAAAAASPDGHLYISSGNDAYYMNWETGATVSYALEGGHISKRPDHIYPANTQGPMAVDAAGDLYASMAGCVVTVYAHNSTHVVRTLNVAVGPSDGCIGYNLYDNISAITVDDRGYLYVSTYWEGSGSVKSRALLPKPKPASEECYDYGCIYVYAPGASGDTPPVQSFSINNTGAGMTTDHTGNLYLQNGNSIIVVAHPITDPKQVRTIVPKGFSGISNPQIVAGLLYADVTQCDDNFYPCKNGIGVFPLDAKGTVAPERFFIEPFHDYWTDWTIWGSGIYALTAASVIQNFDQQATGEAMPSFSQILYPLPAYPQYEAVGP
jgi:hypothetical protein